MLNNLFKYPQSREVNMSSKVVIEQPIRRTVKLSASIEQAFDFFTKEFSRWWPKDYTWSKDCLEQIVIEPKINGRCFEIGPYNFICQWGRVLVWDPPYQLKFTWQINPSSAPDPNPKTASEVAVNFLAENEASTLMTLEHAYIERHGEGAEQFYEAMNSEYGWEKILSCYIQKLKESIHG